MKLSTLIEKETSIEKKHIMFLRHANHKIAKLRKFGSSVEDYTFVQSSGTKYDYLHDNDNPIKIVVAIADDHIYGVFKITGVEKEGTSYELTSKAHHKYLDLQKNGNELAKKFKMEQLKSISTGKRIFGWEGRERTTIQKSNGGFFDKLEIII